MKSILLIGVGRFGRHLAMELNRLGHQIMAVDRDEERVNEIARMLSGSTITPEAISNAKTLLKYSTTNN